MPGDNIIDPKEVSRIIESEADSALLIAESDMPSKYGVVFVEKGIITKIVEKPTEKLSNLISNLNLKRNVKILGWVNQEEVTKLMQDSDILIAPSITANDGDKEGIPVVLMEAQAMGLPVISTYHSGIPELIIDGHNGFLVKERDFSALADKIVTLISCESKINNFKINGKNIINQGKMMIRR